MLTAVASPALPRSSLPPADQQPPLELSPLLAFTALQGKLKPNEVAYRRARLRGAKRFFGLDIHKEYALASAVDGELNFAYGPVNVTWVSVIL